MTTDQPTTGTAIAGGATDVSPRKSSRILDVEISPDAKRPCPVSLALPDPTVRQHVEEQAAGHIWPAPYYASKTDYLGSYQALDGTNIDVKASQPHNADNENVVLLHVKGTGPTGSKVALQLLGGRLAVVQNNTLLGMRSSATRLMTGNLVWHHDDSQFELRFRNKI